MKTAILAQGPTNCLLVFDPDEEKHIPEYTDRRKKADDLSARGVRESMDPKRVAETVLKVVKAR